VPQWITGAFNQLDAEKIENTLADWSRSLYRLAKTFATQPACLPAVTTMRTKV
jgi:hypothetical protein